MDKGVGKRNLPGHIRVSRIEPLGFLEQLQVIIPFSLASPHPGRNVADLAVVRERSRGEVEFFERLIVVRFGPVIIKAEREMAFAEVRFQLERFVGAFLDLHPPFVRGIEPVIDAGERGREPRMRERRPSTAVTSSMRFAPPRVIISRVMAISSRTT